MQSKAQIDQILRQKCEAKEIPGVVAMAATGSEVIYQGAFGKRDLSKDDAMLRGPAGAGLRAYTRRFLSPAAAPYLPGWPPV